jgi:dihydroneopterin aldolase
VKTTIYLDELEVQCLIGCLERERIEPQTLRVDLELELDASQAMAHDDLARTFNYAEIAEIVGFVLRAGRFYLLETAAQVLVRTLLLAPSPAERRPRPSRVQVTLTKFGVLPGKARPRVVVEALARDQQYALESKPWGSVDILAETRLFGLYRLNIDAGCEIPNHLHRHMREAELVLTEGLLGWKDGAEPSPLQVGATLEWRNGQPHGYRASGARGGSILCLDSPPFSPEDEIEVPL